MQLDVGCALADISLVKNLLQVFRNKIDSKHSAWFQKAQRIAEELDVTGKQPRTCFRPANRANTLSDTVEKLSDTVEVGSTN